MRARSAVAAASVLGVLAVCGGHSSVGSVCYHGLRTATCAVGRLRGGAADDAPPRVAAGAGEVAVVGEESGQGKQGKDGGGGGAEKEDTFAPGAESRRRKEEKRRKYEAARDAYISKARWALRKAGWVDRQLRRADRKRQQCIKVSVVLGMRLRAERERRGEEVPPREDVAVLPILVPRSVMLARRGWVYRGGRSDFGLGAGVRGSAWESPSAGPERRGSAKAKPSGTGEEVGGRERRFAVWLCPALDGGGMAVEQLASVAAGGGHRVQAHVPLFGGWVREGACWEEAAARLLEGARVAAKRVGRVRVRVRDGGSRLLEGGRLGSVGLEVAGAGEIERARDIVSSAVRGHGVRLGWGAGGDGGGAAPQVVLGYNRPSRQLVAQLRDRAPRVLGGLGGGVLELSRVSLVCTEGPPNEWYRLGSCVTWARSPEGGGAAPGRQAH